MPLDARTQINRNDFRVIKGVSIILLIGFVFPEKKQFLADFFLFKTSNSFVLEFN